MQFCVLTIKEIVSAFVLWTLDYWNPSSMWFSQLKKTWIHIVFFSCWKHITMRATRQVFPVRSSTWKNPDLHFWYNAPRPQTAIAKENAICLSWPTARVLTGLQGGLHSHVCFTKIRYCSCILQFCSDQLTCLSCISLTKRKKSNPTKNPQKLKQKAGFIACPKHNPSFRWAPASLEPAAGHVAQRHSSCKRVR